MKTLRQVQNYKMIALISFKCEVGIKMKRNLRVGNIETIQVIKISRQWENVNCYWLYERPKPVKGSKQGS